MNAGGSSRKRRPDSLELEVLGASRPSQAVGDEGVNNAANGSQVGTANEPQQQEQQQQRQEDDERRPQAPHNQSAAPATASALDERPVTQPSGRRRWLPHFGGSKARRASDAAEEAPTTAAAATKCPPATPVGGGSAAALAQPEATNIANSSNTILTPQQRPSVQQEVQQSACATPPPLTVPLGRSEPNVRGEDGEAAAVMAANLTAAHWPHDAPLTCPTPRTDYYFAPQERLLLTSNAAADELSATATAAPAANGLRANLLSMLGKLAVWQRSDCRRRRDSKRRSQYASKAGSKKSLNASADFEQFATPPPDEPTNNAAGGGGGVGGVFASARQASIRRLSQIRRRRSSYYFSENERRIRANDREFNAQFKYADNYIKTSKYEWLTFLPLNLLEQFQRLANFYFLCLLVLQLIPAISSLTPVTTAIPLIGVLTLTAVKDAYDDIQRHLSDSQVNNRRSKALRNGKLVDEKWSGVQVGDVIRMENNQFVAADIMLLTTSEPNGLCFIETAELDGETNLKCKQCLTETTEMGQRHDTLWSFNAEIICERPNNLLNKFDGTLMWKNQRYALDNEKVLLRGCVLRNTQWCYGVVIFAGKDTKLMQNSGKTQFKSTGVDRLLNFIIIGIVLFLLSICAFFTLACAIWEGLIGQHFQVYLPWENIIPKDVAQGATVIGLLVFFSYAIVLNTVVPISLYVSVEVIRFIQSFLINWDEKMFYEPSKTHAKARTTTLNEELGQIQYIFSDKTGTLTQNIMTFNKCSINGRAYGDVIDLRTGEVIELSDKQKANFQNSNNSWRHNSSSGSNTATTTTTAATTPPTILLHAAEVHPKATLIVSTAANSPTEDVVATAARLAETAGQWQRDAATTPGSDAGDDGDITTPDETTYTSTDTEATTSARAAASGYAEQRCAMRAADERLYLGPTATTAASATTLPESTAPRPPNADARRIRYANAGSRMPAATGGGRADSDEDSASARRVRRQQSTLSTTTSDKALEPVDFSGNREYEPDFRWYDSTLLDAVRSDEEHAHNFFRLLALCHTVMPEYVEGRLEYQAQSPDESALVSAARNFGFVFRSRTPNSITIEVMGKTEEYELLNILDFNNVRKRMSVILRRGDDIILYCKGADNVIYDRLSSSQLDMKARTQEHLNKFAGEGLRTLVLAERRLDLDYFNDWTERQQEAAISMDGREDKLGAIYEEIESDLSLVGVTAIEDKLQDGVPQTIANLQMAGIKIWVLTGDKQETAINIGYSCQLLTDELADVFVVDGGSLEEVEKQLRQFRESICIVNRFKPTPLEPTVNLNLNGDRHHHHHHGMMSHHHGSAFRAQVSPPPPPAISVVTFRWDDDNIKKRKKGEPDSAECNELYDNLEKGDKGVPAALNADDLVDDSTGFAIVVNGHSLVYCLSPELETRFLDIASQCKAVICCRVTPLQKALVVELIKRAKNAVTLAIGDGANDVSMIKAAHIGVGISGQEGLQAVLASDYSIAQFRYLERLLLVHGRWSYYRMCKFLRYFFYKNFAFTLCHCWYSFFCGFSAQTVFDPMFISVYNLFYTSLPVLSLGVFEQDVSEEHSVEYPKLYTPGLRSQLFNTKEFVYSVLHGVFSSLILFLIPYGTYKDGVSPNGHILSDHMTLGAVVASILIIDNTAQIALYTSYWTIFNHITIWGSLVWYFVLDYFYNYVIGGPYVGSLSAAIKDLTFWATMFITVTMIMAPVLAYKFCVIDCTPSLADKIRLKRRQATQRSRQTSSVLRTPSSRRGRRSLRSGYAFAHQEGFGRLITSGKIMRKLPQEFAFPLGLGSKKAQHPTTMTATAVTAAIDAAGGGAAHQANNNNNNSNNNNHGSGPGHNSTRNNRNSSLADLNASSHGGGGGDDDASPRAPYQDLDTINL